MKLIDFMTHHKISPISMAHFVETTPTTIYAIMKHGQKPRQKIAERIEKFTLGVVTVKELRGGHDARKPRKRLGKRREDCDNARYAHGVYTSLGGDRDRPPGEEESR